jgi:VIT1/CCC1 family predicted Fe2+/Mn2+ transporter
MRTTTRIEEQVDKEAKKEINRAEVRAECEVTKLIKPMTRKKKIFAIFTYPLTCGFLFGITALIIPLIYQRAHQVKIWVILLVVLAFAVVGMIVGLYLSFMIIKTMLKDSRQVNEFSEADTRENAKNEPETPVD